MDMRSVVNGYFQRHIFTSSYAADLGPAHPIPVGQWLNRATDDRQ